MKVTFLFKVLFVCAIAFSFNTQSYAVPAFARQTGMACNACHFQAFPVLNAFGREFKANGYTMVGGNTSENMLAGDFLSLPSTLNASVVGKFRYQKSNGSDKSSGTNKGEFQTPDELALLLGGRVGEHIGFLIEGQIADAEAPFAVGFKMPFSYDVKGVKLSVIPFMTDALGASYGFELLNTGSVRNVRSWENRKDISAQQFLNTDGAATGIALVAYKNWGYINFTKYTPLLGASDSGPFMNYFRLALTPQVGDWDLGFGTQLWSGKSSYNGDDGQVDEEIAAWTADAQLQGTLSELPIGVYLTYGSTKKSDDNFTNILNTGKNGNKTCFTLATEVGVIPERLSLGLSYRLGDTGNANNNKNNSLGLMAKYKLAQNVMFQFNQSLGMGDYYDIAGGRPNGKNMTTIMLFTSF